jgi:hypothetical protein
MNAEAAEVEEVAKIKRRIINKYFYLLFNRWLFVTSWSHNAANSFISEIFFGDYVAIEVGNTLPNRSLVSGCNLNQLHPLV